MKDALPISMRDLSVVGYPDYVKAKSLWFASDFTLQTIDVPEFTQTLMGWPDTISSYVYTFKEDGWIHLSLAGLSGTTTYVVINGIPILATNKYVGDNIFVPVKTGDFIGLDATSLSGYATFMPKRS